jgi:hypothetical protein
MFLAAMLALLLVCFLLPSSALAAHRLGNDNHTDSDDYCLRAHDVTVGLSEFSTKSRSELENDIIHASAFDFLIRDTANETGLFVPITSGYSLDFSNLTEAATSSGYSVTVTLPAITMSSSTTITFRVFVEDDLPQPRQISYAFESATAGHALPESVLSLLPAGESRLSGETVAPGAAFPVVRDGAGNWTFSGWTPESVTLEGIDVTFTGTWVWTALPVYTVNFEFVSGTSGKSLPSGVLEKLPAAKTGVDGDVFTPSGEFRAYHTQQGAWRFHGWNPSSQTIAGSNLTFTGEWRWHKNKVATPSPTLALTPTPSPSPTAAPTLAPTQPAPSPEIPAISTLEQTPSDPQMPLSGGSTGGTAQMAIATVLTALVAAQAFAIASDLKVLKWYNAKKAARRANV